MSLTAELRLDCSSVQKGQLIDSGSVAGGVGSTCCTTKGLRDATLLPKAVMSPRKPGSPRPSDGNAFTFCSISPPCPAMAVTSAPV